MDRKIEKGNRDKFKLYGITATVCIVIIACYGFLISDRQSKLVVDKRRITISRVQQGDFQEYIPVDGTVLPGESIYLDVMQAGTVEKKYAEDGAWVKQGDTLVKLTNVNLELEFINRETQMFDILNNLQSSKAALDRNKVETQKQLLELDYKIDALKKKYDINNELYNNKVIASSEYEDTKRDYNYLINQKQILLASHKLDSVFISTQIQSLNAGILRMHNNLGGIHKILDQLYVVAPVNGQLSSLNAYTGQLKQAGDKLGQVDIPDFYKINIAMDQRYVARVFLGQEATLDYEGSYYTLNISKIFPEVKEGVFSVDLLFKDKVPQGIRRGQNIPVRVKFGGVSKTLIIDKGAFYQTTGGNWIYVVNGDHTAVKRTIHLGRQNTEVYEILDGLSAGEMVISSAYNSFNGKDKLILK